MRLLSLLLLIFAARPASAGVPPGQDWLTLFTPHFRVHHTPPQEAFAKEFARHLETALPALSRDLQWTPRTPIDIVVNDRSDDANGLALSFPANRLEVYAVPFDAELVLMEYNNWVEELAVHELTHIIANDSSFGAYRWLRSIFGSVIKPNGLQPPWLVEGLAVYEETKYTRGGRGRSAFTEAVLRNTDWSNLSLDRLGDGPFWWPAGHTPYLYGYALQAMTSDPGRISRENASSLPYRLDRVAERSSGADWADHWGKLQAKVAALQPNPPALPEASCLITNAGRETGGHAVSEDGWIYFTLTHRDSGDSLARMRADIPCGESQWEILAPKDKGGPAAVNVSPQGESVAYSARVTWDTYYATEDIFLYQPALKTVERLTHGARAHDPVFGATANEIIYVANKGDSRQALFFHKRGEKNGREIFTSKVFERLANPFFHAGRIYFTRHNNRGQEEIFWIPLRREGEAATESAATPAVTIAGGKGSRFFERHPMLTASGELFFTANYPEKRAGYSLYRAAPGSREAGLRLDSAGGLFLRPRIFAQQLFLNAYTKGGFELLRLPIAAKNKSDALRSLDLFRALAAQPAAPLPEQKLENTSSQEYSPSTAATSLWPQYWAPSFALVPRGFHAGAYTSGNDPLERHGYSLLGLYDSRTNFPIYEASYAYRRWPVQLHFASVQTNSYLESSGRSNQNTTHSAQLVYPLDGWVLSAGAAAQTRFFLQTKTQNYFLLAAAVNSSSWRTPSAIAPNRGHNFELHLGAYPKTRYDVAFVDVRPRLALYGGGLHPSHSVMLEARSGITTNHFLASNYYLGGGPSQLGGGNFIVHGYPTDTLLGQRILTGNLHYTLPLAHIYRGWHVHPIFLRTLGLRLMLDAGTANLLARYDSRYIFQGYGRERFGSKFIAGGGADLLLDGSLFYYVPAQLVVGAHYGFLKNFGGALTGFLGLNFSLPTAAGITTAR